MVGVIGALVALGVVLAIVVVLAVRPPARRAARALAALRAETTAGLDRLRDLRPRRRARPPDGPARDAPSPGAPRPSLIGGRGRHRRTPGWS